MKIKYKILKLIDVSGFTFLDPIVRLCCGEEPEVQIRRIFRFIVVPIVAVVAFVILWSYLAPRHTTKSGEVPSPQVVWDAGAGIWTFHQRESRKSAAYVSTPEEARKLTEDAKARIEWLDTEAIPAARANVEQIRSERDEWQTKLTASLAAKIAERREQFESRDKEQLEKVRDLAASADSAEDSASLLAAMRAYEAEKAAASAELELISNQLKSLQSRRYPPMYEAEYALSRYEGEKQYWTQFISILASNRSERTAQMINQLKEMEAELLEKGVAMSEQQRFGHALRQVRFEDRLERTETSTYSAARTFPYQIRRSLLCVFAGFILASCIAIPAGILCGLSPTFMAAMTPFIAIFKPVSPIVWLPIALIVVGGFVSNPESFQRSMESLPLLGAYSINPAFLASAITVALCSLWPTLVNTALGVASIDKDHLNVARVLRLGFWDRLIRIVIPSALPLIFAGLRISLGVGWMVLIAAELLASSEGIGKFVWDMFNNGSSESFAQMFVVVFVVGIIGFFLDRIMIILQRLVTFDGSASSI